MVRITCIVAVISLLMFDGVFTSMTVCDCKYTLGGCQQGESQEGSCSIEGKKFPRCCKTTGKDDQCECRAKCHPHEYQKDDCTHGYVCCPRASSGFDPWF